MTDIPFQLSVSYGTDHHPFKRLTSWIDEWSSQQVASRVVLLVQSGFSQGPLSATRTETFLAHDDLLAWFANSQAVIVQGGPGGIMDSRAQGILPIVVPRRSDLGEHVDDHQILFAREMAASGLVLNCESKDALFEALDRAQSGALDLRIPGGESDSGAPAAIERRLGSMQRVGTGMMLKRLRFVLGNASDHRFKAD